MALIKCPECGKEISNQTKSCPHCGYRLNSMSLEEKSSIRKTVCWILGTILAIALIVVIYDATTISLDEQTAELKKAREEYKESQERLNDLKREKAINDWLIDQYDD